jgi:hypothetical protein
VIVVTATVPICGLDQIQAARANRTYIAVTPASPRPRLADSPVGRAECPAGDRHEDRSQPNGELRGKLL